MTQFVDRLIAYETKPRPDITRNMMRFVTSEGRFGPLIDHMLEGAFRKVLSDEIDPAYDIEVTFASARSPFLWPPAAFNDKVISSFNEGSLFFTYVGHGFAKGFDTMRVGGQYFPILNMEHIDRIAVKGTPPVLFVLACTTAMFDGKEDGIGEALLKCKDGPIAYWGATRICHPASNTLLGRALAQAMTSHGRTARLGEILDKARDAAMGTDTNFEAMIRIGIEAAIRGEETSVQELTLQSSFLYTLLGDPATRLAVPRGGITVAARPDGTDTLVEARGDFPDGAEAQVRVEVPRNQNPIKPARIDNPLDPSSFPAIRENHRGMNDRVIGRVKATFQNGVFTARVATGGYTPGWVAKVIVLTPSDIHHGATILR